MPHSDPEVAREYRRRYRELNRVRILAGKKAWWQKNKTDQSEKKKQWRARNLELFRQRKKSEYQRNKDKYKARAKEYDDNRKPFWKKKFEKALSRARAIGAEIVDIDGIKEFFRQTFSQTACICDYCRGVFVVRNISVEHKQPYFLGGQHAVTNFAVSCRRCNNKKGKRPYDRWVSICEKGDHLK